MGARPTRRTLAVGLSAALALATAAPGAAQPTSESYSRAPPSRTPPSSRDPEGHPQRQHGLTTGEEVAIGVGAAALACLIFCHKHHDTNETRKPDGNDDAPDRRDLLENGPHVSASRPEGAFAVYGFVRAGWPIVLDYDADPGARVLLTVNVFGHEPWVDRLKPGRHLVTEVYNGPGARDATPALVTVEAVARDDPRTPARLEILGIGSGPRSVGSAGGPGLVGAGFGFGPGVDAVAIDQLTFRPSPTRSVGGDFAEFGYQTASLFSRVDMEVLRYGKADTRSGRRVIPVDIARTYGETLLRPGPYGPKMWDGLDAASRQASHGAHRLQVRGWEVTGDESWVVALSNQAVVAP